MQGKNWRELAARAAIEQDPNKLITETLHLSSRDTLPLHVALDGGFVAQFVRMEK